MSLEDLLRWGHRGTCTNILLCLEHV